MYGIKKEIQIKYKIIDPQISNHKTVKNVLT